MREDSVMVVENIDLGYANQCDLPLDTNVETLKSKAAVGWYDGGPGGPPCSTWTRLRYRAGGPPPLRSREYPWGLPHLTAGQRRSCDTASLILYAVMEVLTLIAGLGGTVTMEHPEDPSHDPCPSIWATSMVINFEKLVKAIRCLLVRLWWGGTKDAIATR